MQAQSSLLRLPCLWELRRLRFFVVFTLSYSDVAILNLVQEFLWNLRTPRHSHLGPLASQDLFFPLFSLRQGSAVCLLLHSQRIERGGQEALPAFVAVLLLLEAVAVLPELQPGQPLRLFFGCGGDSLTSANASLWLVGDLREHLQRLSPTSFCLWCPRSTQSTRRSLSAVALPRCQCHHSADP